MVGSSKRKDLAVGQDRPYPPPDDIASDTTLPALVVHPGIILREEILPSFFKSHPELETSERALAEAIGISRSTFNRLLTGRARISPHWAIPLGDYVGVSPRYLLQLQSLYDEYEYVRSQTFSAQAQGKVPLPPGGPARKLKV